MTEEKKAPDGASSGVSDSTQLLAANLSRWIFASGNEHPEYGGITQRIQFMGGKWPNAEKPMGGFCEDALANCIEKFLTANAE